MISLISEFLKYIKELIIMSKAAASITEILDDRSSAIKPKKSAPADIRLNVIVWIPITLPLRLSGTFICNKDIEPTIKIEFESPVKIMRKEEIIKL